MLPVELTRNELEKLEPGTVILRKTQRPDTYSYYLQEIIFNRTTYNIHQNLLIVHWNHFSFNEWNSTDPVARRHIEDYFFGASRAYTIETFYHRPQQLIHDNFVRHRVYSYIDTYDQQNRKRYRSFSFQQRAAFRDWKSDTIRQGRIFDINKSVFSYHFDDEFNSAINNKSTSKKRNLNEAIRSDHSKQETNAMVIVPGGQFSDYTVAYNQSLNFNFANQTTPTKEKSSIMPASTNWNVYRVVAQLVPSEKAQAQGKAPKVLLVDDIQAITTSDAERIALAKVLRKHKDIDPLRIHISV